MWQRNQQTFWYKENMAMKEYMQCLKKFWLGLSKSPVWNPMEPLPVSVDSIELVRILVWLNLTASNDLNQQTPNHGLLCHEKSFPVVFSTYCSTLLPVIFQANLLKKSLRAAFTVKKRSESARMTGSVEAAARHDILTRFAGKIRDSSAE